jgi:hypothetical protein
MQANLSHLGAIFNAYLALDCVPLVVGARKKIDKIRKFFLCKGEENANGTHCLVNWLTVCKPNDPGGMGVPNLDRFATALCLC